VSGRGPPCLVREQQYLDDPARPDPWAEVVAVGVRRFSLSATMSGGGSPDDDGAADAGRREDSTFKAEGGVVPVPSSVWVRLESDAGAVYELLRVR
jgi:hypothetical protein